MSAPNIGKVGAGRVITPSDLAADNFPEGITDGLYVGVSGNLTVVLNSGAALLFTAAAAGYHPIRCKRVNATGTAASAIVAYWDGTA